MWKLLLAIFLSASAFAQTPAEYRVLATSKTSTMEKEMNEAAAAGFAFAATMGGETSFGGNEMVVIMGRAGGGASRAYKVLATNRTSTMQKEMNAAAAAGFHYRGQTVYKSAFGGNEVVIIMERGGAAGDRGNVQYHLLATRKTGTMQKEIQAAAAEGFTLEGLAVGQTAMGGNELVVIMSRPARQNY